VPQHSVLLGPRYKGLLDDIFKHHKLADDFSLYLHRPTELDPVSRRRVAIPSTSCPGAASRQRYGLGGKAEPFRAAIQQRLEETVLPGPRLSIRDIQRDDAAGFPEPAARLQGLCLRL
jgi:phytoene desaturase